MIRKLLFFGVVVVFFVHNAYCDGKTMISAAGIAVPLSCEEKAHNCLNEGGRACHDLPEPCNAEIYQIIFNEIKKKQPSLSHNYIQSLANQQAARYVWGQTQELGSY